jgi:hypothetical protein
LLEIWVQIFFIADHISLIEKGLALHDKFSQSPVDQAGPGGHDVRDNSVRLSQARQKNR